MIYKVGSRGQMVKDIQEVVGSGADGIFGPATAEAVKKWQAANGLDADGLVGPATLEAMDLLDTDISEKTYTTENGLIIHQHFLPRGEYLDGPTKKEYCFLHHTAGWHNPYKCIDNWGRDSRGRIATEFVLGGGSVKGNDDKYDGEMVQAFPEGGYAWHLGKNGSQHMHKHSVGIEICNFGYVKNGKTYAGTTVAESQKVELPKRLEDTKLGIVTQINKLKLLESGFYSLLIEIILMLEMVFRNGLKLKVSKHLIGKKMLTMVK